MKKQEISKKLFGRKRKKVVSSVKSEKTIEEILEKIEKKPTKFYELDEKLLDDTEFLKKIEKGIKEKYGESYQDARRKKYNDIMIFIELRTRRIETVKTYAQVVGKKFKTNKEAVMFYKSEQKKSANRRYRVKFIDNLKKVSVILQEQKIFDTDNLNTKNKEEIRVENKKDNTVEENETKKEKSCGKSSKLGGAYDSASQEVKDAYDNMMKKSFTNDLNKLSNEQIAYLNALFYHKCSGIDKNNMTVEDTKLIAVAKKINNRFNKINKNQEEKVVETNDETLQKQAIEKINKKLK